VGAATGATIGERLARLLADTMSKHKAVSLPAETAARAGLWGVLTEQLEGTAAAAVAQVLGDLADDPDLPGEGRELVRLMTAPAHQTQWLLTIGAAIGILQAGGPAAAAAVLRDIESAAWRRNPTQVLTPEQAAVAVLKNVGSQENLAAEARLSGLNPGRFLALVQMAGNPPGLAELLTLYRRGDISEGRLLTGIRQSELRDEWADEVKRLRYSPPSPEVMLAAAEQHQISEGEAKRVAAEGGLDPAFWSVALKTIGTPPGRDELLELWRRGKISRADVVQGMRESPLKTKYAETLTALKTRVPPPDTIGEMFGKGVIDHGTALNWMADNGIEGPHAAAWLDKNRRTEQAASRDLAKSEVLTLYGARAITRAKAAGLLDQLGYDQGEAGMLLELVDTARLRRTLESAISRTRTLYVGHRIDRSEAAGLLDRLGVPADQRADLLEVWELERAANVRDLTQPQIVQAYRRGLFTRDQAGARLRGIGYEPADAELLVSLATPAE